MWKRSAFGAQLTAALQEAVIELEKLIAGERLYAFALYTSGEDEFSYVLVSANTEERSSPRDPNRWSAQDWPWFDFSPSVAELELPPEGGRRRDATVYSEMVEAMRAVRLPEGTTRLIVCGDMSNAFFRRGMKLLNPKSAFEAYLREYTSEPFFEQFDRMSGKERPSALLGLWRDLSLDASTALADEARTRGATAYEVRDRLVKVGARLVPDLLEVIEQHLEAAPFNEKGTEAWKRRGAFTAETSLASSAVFLIKELGRMSAPQLERLQHLLVRRVQFDRSLAKTSTMAENIARVMHQLFPKRFPQSELDPKTNHLRNPEPFLPAVH